MDYAGVYYDNGNETCPVITWKYRKLKIPKLFLHLTEEARDVEVNNDISGCTEETKSQATGFAGVKFW